MRKIFLILALLILPLAAHAQGAAEARTAAEISAETDDDQGFITRFVQEKLSGAGRQVQIRGFRGALSSRATFDELTVADADGVWLTLRGGAIQWTRTALLLGRVEVGELSATEVLLPRMPGGGDDAPKPEAELPEFALPELPVALNLNQIKVDRVVLGEPVLGFEAVLAVSGDMSLEGGEGAATLAITRLDGPRGQFALDAGYSNKTSVLNLDLALDEDAGGLFAMLTNLHGAPAVKAAISGHGPMDAFAADIELATDGQPRITGQASIKAQAAPDDAEPGRAFRLDLSGDVASLLAPQNRAFFGTNTRLLAEGWRGDSGRLNVPALMVATEALNLSGSLATNAQGGPQSAVLLMTLGADAGAQTLPVALPFVEGATVRDGRLALQYDAAQGAGWTLEGRIGQITTQGNQIAQLSLNGGGAVVLAGAELAEISGAIDFGAQGMGFDDAALAQAVGGQITGRTDFNFTPGNAVAFSGLRIEGADYGLTGDLLMAGLSSGVTVSGALDAAYGDLARLSGVAGRPLTGRADVALSGLYTVLSRGFYVDAQVTGTDITAGQDQIDGILRGQSRIGLTARRDGDGLSLDDLTITATGLSGEASGYVTSDSMDVSATLALADLTAADPAWGGSAQLEAFVNGAPGTRRLTVSGDAQDLRIGLAALEGALRGKTTLAVVAGEAPGGFALEHFSLVNPQLKAEGQGAFGADTLDGAFTLTMPDLSVLGRGWSGGIDAQATARMVDGARQVQARATGRDLRLGQANVDGALVGDTDLVLTAAEKDGVITLDGFDLRNGQMDVTAAGTYGPGVTDLSATADIAQLGSFGQGWRGSLRADATLREDGSGGRLLVVDGVGRDLGFGQAQLDNALAGQTRLAVRGTERDGVFAIDVARIENPNLNATATGSVGAGATDLRARLAAGDLRFLGRGFAGALSADATIRDQGGQRRITAQGTANGLAIGQARVDPLLRGQTRFDLDAQQGNAGLSVNRLMLRNPQLQISADGSPSAGLNVDARLSDLALIQREFAGPVQVTGTLREIGADYGVNLAVQAPGGTRAQITGRAARDGRTMDIRASGTTDAAVANPLLRTRSVEGPVNFDIRVNGAPSVEAVTGRVQLVNGRLVDPKLGIRMDSLGVTADLRNGRIAVDGGGAVAAGGRLAVRGPVDLRGGTLDLAVTLRDVVARDPNLYEIRLNGDVTITGAMQAGPLVGGRIFIANGEFRIPATGLGGAKAIPLIDHRGDDRAVAATRAKAGLEAWPSAAAREAGMSGPAATPPARPARLDLLIEAPNQMFIRGRGVDAEMGGRLRLTGTAAAVVPIGFLELIRGRVDLLGKRFDLTEGLIEMQGSLVPVLRLVAETAQDGIVTRIIIDGDVRSPDIRFEASPDMPEEEVLSQLLFGRGLDNISALQAAQLANAVAVLAGRGGEGIVGRLRQQTGLDDLDLSTDDQGNVQLRAGKYLSENVYTDVAVGDDGKTQINLNLDISATLRARGAVDSDGKSTIGLYYERDY